MNLHNGSLSMDMDNKGEGIVRFKDKKISWNVTSFDKAAFSGNFDIFEQINDYWATLPVERQGEIFAVFEKIRAVYDSVWNTPALILALQPLVKEFYDLHDLNHMRRWVDFHANIISPRGLMSHYDENSYEMPGTRERTYLVDDYQWLLTLTVALRPMYLIWGEYIFRTREDTGTRYKEMSAAKLLNKCNLYNSIPMQKLRVYVQQTIPAEKSKAAAILHGLSTEDFPIWIMGLVLVRRLTVVDIRGTDPNTTIVTFIYRYVDQKVNTHENSFPSGRVNDKTIDTSAQDGDSNISALENYKIREELSTGDVAIIDFFVNQTHNLAKRICPDVDLNLLDEFLKASEVLMNEEISDGQVILAQWTLAEEVNARGLRYLKKETVRKAMAVAQTILWQNGYRELAALITASIIPNSEEMNLSLSGGRSRIPRETVDKLHELYPFSKRGKGAKTVRPQSAAQISIELVHDEFIETDWKLNIPPKRIEELTGNKNNIRYTAPGDLRIHLSDLAVAIGTPGRTFAQPRQPLV